MAAGNDASLEVSQQVPATYPEGIAIASTTAERPECREPAWHVRARTGLPSSGRTLVLGQTLNAEQIRSRILNGAINIGSARVNSPAASCPFDGVREGVLSAPGTLAQ